MKSRNLLGLGAALLLALSCSGRSPAPIPDSGAEKREIAKVIETSIGWAANKDRDLLFNSVAQDSSFFIYHPDSASTIVGFDTFRQMVDELFMRPEFKATGHEVKDLRIHLSRSGDAAWFSAFLDDFSEWDGQPMGWVNARWTGVLEKRDGKWVIVQMHFSLPQG
jgi:hypothetical protein